MRYYKGDSGHFYNLSHISGTVDFFVNPAKNFIPNCMTGVNYAYLLVTKGRVIEEVKHEECFICATTDSLELSDQKKKFFPLVWSQGYCSSKCNPWAKEDRKTGYCYPFYSNLTSYDFSNKPPADSYVCGDTFLDFKNNENCEYYGTFDIDKNCIKETCNVSKATGSNYICQIDAFGKSLCEECTPELCTKNKYNSYYMKKCLSETGCNYNFEQFQFIKKTATQSKTPGQSGGGLIVGNKAQYMDQNTLEVKDCDSVELNINDKMGNPKLAFENCRKCSSTGYFRADPDIKFCFDESKNRKREYLGRISFVTEDLIDKIGWVMLISAMFMILSGVLLLRSLNCITIFFRFWEIMQYCYMMGYYVDNTFMSRLFFQKFSFVTFEILNFRGYITLWFLRLLVNKEEGLVVVETSFRNLQTQLQFSTYKKNFTKYYEFGKVGLFVFDAGAILDVYIITMVGLILFRIGYALVSRRIKGPTMDRIEKFNKGLITTFTFWYMIENMPIFLFFGLGQYYMIPSKINRLTDPVILTNKIILDVFSTFFLLMLPIYLIGVAAKIFKNEVVLTRIKDLGFIKAGLAMRFLYPMSLVRRILFTLYFIPSVNTSGSTFYPFMIILLEALELTILIFSEVYKHLVVTYLHIFGSLVMIVMSIVLMTDKLLSGIYYNSKDGSRNKKSIDQYFYVREFIFMFGSIVTFFGFVLGALWIIFVLRKKIINKEKYSSKDYVRENEDSERDTSLYLNDNALGRKDIELAAI